MAIGTDTKEDPWGLMRRTTGCEPSRVREINPTLPALYDELAGWFHLPTPISATRPTRWTMRYCFAKPTGAIAWSTTDTS